MTAEKINTTEIRLQLDETTSNFLNILSSFDEEQINIAPFKNSWTAAQVADHVMQSNHSIIKSLNTEGKTTLRNADEGALKLKEIFLNFNTKIQSPKFILPGRDTYNKQELIDALNDSIEHIKKLSSNVDLSETITHPVFGDITKLELIHFVVYHTQRHIHQVKNIFQAVSKK